jgi:hypothetical protein
LQVCSRMLNRYGKDKDAAAPAGTKSVI